MIRFFRAYLRFRWRLLVNSVRGGVEREWGARLSRIAGLLTPVVVGLITIPFSVSLAALAFIWGWTLAAAGEVDPAWLLGFRIALAIATFFTIFTPNWRSGRVDPSGMIRLALLPIPMRLLYLGEALSVLSNPWLLAFLPGLLMLPLGLLVGGAFVEAAVALVGAALFLALLAFLGALLSSLLELIMRNRTLWESLMMVGLAAIIVFSFFPHVFQADRVDIVRGGEEGRVSVEFPWWSWLLPSETLAAAVHATVAGEGAVPAVRLLVLFLVAAVAGDFSWRLWRYGFRTVATSGTRGGRQKRLGIRRTLPGLSSAVSSLALNQVRGYRRSLRGRIGIFFPPLITTSLLLTVQFGRGQKDFAFLTPVLGPLVALLGVTLAVLMVSAITNNQFALEGAGLQLLFLQPLSMAEIVVAKLVGNGILVGTGAGLALGSALVLAPPSSLLLYLAVPIGGFGIYMLSAPTAVFFSALFPRSADPGKIGRAGNAHPAAELLTAAWASALTTPLALLGYYGVAVLESSAAVLLGALLWAVLATALAALLLHAATGFADSRRETMLQMALESSRRR